MPLCSEAAKPVTSWRETSSKTIRSWRKSPPPPPYSAGTDTPNRPASPGFPAGGPAPTWPASRRAAVRSGGARLLQEPSPRGRGRMRKPSSSIEGRLGDVQNGSWGGNWAQDIEGFQRRPPRGGWIAPGVREKPWCGPRLHRRHHGSGVDGRACMCAWSRPPRPGVRTGRETGRQCLPEGRTIRPWSWSGKSPRGLRRGRTNGRDHCAIGEMRAAPARSINSA